MLSTRTFKWLRFNPRNHSPAALNLVAPPIQNFGHAYAKISLRVEVVASFPPAMITFFKLLTAYRTLFVDMKRRVAVPSACNTIDNITTEFINF